ncbi:MAG: glycosyltransferase family 2 protein [Actinobacteria bacterium]|nr:glycosyltransferase family 2 protein [Actinomycetota bacterium]
MDSAAAEPPRETGTWLIVAMVAGAVALLTLLGSSGFVFVISAFLSALFLLYLIRHVAFGVSAGLWGRATLDSPADLSFRPPLSVIVACKNEELVVDTLVDRLLDLEYPADRLQVVIVDDNSDDRTGEILDARAAEEPRLRILHRPPGSTGGKSGALNDAWDLCTGEILVIFDADHEPDPDTLLRIARHFEDDQTGAVMGRCVIKNRDDSLISRLVWLEYLSGYLCDEFGRQAVYGLPAYGGANCAVRVSALNYVGGYNEHSVTEDTDLTLRLLLAGYRIRFDPTALDYEEAVPTLAQYRKQRYRWSFGHHQCWRDYGRAVTRANTLSPLEKVETLMFLWLYHVPVASFMSLMLIPLLLLGLGASLGSWVLVLFPLFLLGPFLQIGSSLLMTKDASPKHVWLMFLLIPVVIAYVFTCSRSWYNGVRSKPYTWVKTARKGP